jgi:hypothetical protein
MLGATIKETLKTIEGGETYSIWNLLPDNAGGKFWLDEIKDCARSMQEYLDDDKEYDIDDLRDVSGEWADRETEDSYFNINRRVQDLGLWASNEIDQIVAELFGDLYEKETPTITDLNSRYLYAAMNTLFDAVADQAYINSEDDRYSANLQDDMAVAK